MKNRILSVLFVGGMLAFVCIGSASLEKYVTQEETEVIYESESTGELIVSDWCSYTGYLDEGVFGLYSFFKEDFDEDGLEDRIYRTYEEADACHYRIEFGNGESFDMEKRANAYGTPTFQCIDISGDGQKDIIYLMQYRTSTDPYANGDFAIFLKDNEGYKEVANPFLRDDSTCYSATYYRYEITVFDDGVKVTVPDFQYEVTIPYGEDTPLSYYYENDLDISSSYYVHGSNSNIAGSEIFDYEIDYSEEIPQVVCKGKLFDKWSNCVLGIKLRYEKDAFVAESIRFVEDETKIV